MTRNDRRARAAHLALLAGVVALSSACGIIPKREPVGIHEPPRPAQAQHPEWPQANWSLLVAKPIASGLLDNDRIAVRPAAGDITVYKASAWTDTGPELVQSALLHRFEDSGKILSVARPGSGVRGEFQLQTELRAFEAVYVGALPEAQVELQAKLVNTASGEVVAARNFRETQAASSESLDDVVLAFGGALDRVTDQAAGWTLASGNSYAGRKR